LEYNPRGELVLLENRRSNKNNALLSSYAYEYDANGMIIKETEKVDSYTYIRNFIYDDAGQLIAFTEKNGGKTESYSYTYDNAGNRVGMTYVDAQNTRYWTDYIYNDNNELIKSTENYEQNKNKIISEKTDYVYDADGNLISKKVGDHPNKGQWEYFYTAESRLRAVTENGTLLMAASYDGDNNRVFQISLTERDSKEKQENDIAKAYKDENGNSYPWEDGNGNGGNGANNPTTTAPGNSGNNGNGNSGNGNSNGNNSSGSNDNSNNTGDATGHNHTGDNKDGCKHALCKLLSVAEKAIGTVRTTSNEQYVKNLTDMSVIFSADDSLIEFLPVNDVNVYKKYELIAYINDITMEYEKPLVEYSGRGTATGTYEYGLERLSVEYVNGYMENYLYNGAGSVVQTTMENGSLFLRYTYGAFGEPHDIRAPLKVDLNDLNRYTYNAEDYDYNTGLQYLRARYYQPQNGNFITQDTYLGRIIEPISMNRYTYVNNNPVNYIDPSGHTASNKSVEAKDKAYRAMCGSIIDPIVKEMTDAIEKLIKNNVINAGVDAAYLRSLQWQAGTGGAGIESFLLLSFYFNVKAGGPMDYKKPEIWKAALQNVPYPGNNGERQEYTAFGVTISASDLGNLNYGMVGKAYGFSETLLLQQAGAAHLRDHEGKGFISSQIISKFVLGKGNQYGDEKDDFIMINQGFDKFKELVENWE
jgi:RHS repeat-associated protein